MSVRIGVIGTGKMAMKRHLPALKKLEETGKCKLIVLCDLNLDTVQTVSKNFNVAEFETDASKVVVRDDIDAVCIFGPPEVHYRFGLLALQNGKHLFVEKPPAPSTPQLLEMVVEAEKRKLVAVVGLNRRFQKNIELVRQRLSAESILTAEAFFHKVSAGIAARLGMNSWLRDSGIHALDVLCYIMGSRPTSIFSIKNGGNLANENFSAVISWGNRHAIFSSNNSSGIRSEKYIFHSYGISYSLNGDTMLVQKDGAINEELVNDADVKGGILEEFSDFIESIISNNRKSRNTLIDSFPALRLVELIEIGYSGEIDWSLLVNKATAVDDQLSIKNVRVIPKIDKPRILILNPSVLGEELTSLEKDFLVVYLNDLPNLTTQEKNKIVGVITGGPGATPATEELFASLPSLGVLGVVGASVKRWGGEEAVKYGVAVINTADVYAGAVAEFIVMQAILGLRKASVSHEVMRNGGWGFSNFSNFEKLNKFKNRLIRKLSILIPSIKYKAPQQNIDAKYQSKMLKNRTIGLIGYGEITKKTIPMFKSFGCTVLVCSEYLNEHQARELGCKKSSLSDVLRADVVSIQRGLNSKTEQAFGVKEIESLRPGCVFINSARAGLVDNKALVARLKKGDIFACLDVFDEEPPNKNDLLRKLPNVFLGSHIAGSIKHVEGMLDESVHHLINKVIDYLENPGDVDIMSPEYIKNLT